MKTEIRRNTRDLIIIGAIGVGLTLIVAPARLAETAPNATLVASVYKQECRGPEFVYVTLTATLSPPQRNVAYTWDFNSDGVYDTTPSQNPMVSHFYPDGTNQIATVKVIRGTQSATASVAFDALQCPN